jgi:hypothetical protein
VIAGAASFYLTLLGLLLLKRIAFPRKPGPASGFLNEGADGKVIFFSSIRDGFRCIWAQRLGANLRPLGAAFAVYHSHERRRSLGNLSIDVFEIGVGPNFLVFDHEERTVILETPTWAKTKLQPSRSRAFS